MKDGDIHITQTNAIILHLAGKAGILGSTSELQAKAHQLLCFSQEVRTPYCMVCYRSTADTFEAMRDEAMDMTIRPKIEQLGALCDKSTGPYLLGEELTYADLLWADLLEQVW